MKTVFVNNLELGSICDNFVWLFLDQGSHDNLQIIDIEFGRGI